MKMKITNKNCKKGWIDEYMESSMGFQAINPTIADTITELFFLPVQNVLQSIKQDLLALESM